MPSAKKWTDEDQARKDSLLQGILLEASAFMPLASTKEKLELVLRVLLIAGAGPELMEQTKGLFQSCLG